MSRIYEKHNYLDKSIPFLKSCVIREYDMRDAGFTIIKNNKLFSRKDISRLESYGKMKRNIEIGKMLRDNRDVSVRIMEEFIQIRKKFIELNDIQDNDILSIKKDSITTINKFPTVLKFDGYEFRSKGKYSSYFYLNDKEFYYSSWDNVLVTKGFGEEVVETHENHFLSDIKTLIKQFETLDSDKMVRVLKLYRLKYLNMELPVEHYRELNVENLYRLKLKILGQPVYVDAVEDIDLEQIDISYNYIHYIIPMIGVMI